MPKTENSLKSDYFDDVYRQNNDPWNFESSPYELSKYKATLVALPHETYRHAFEIGCSIGVLTEMLAPRCTDLLSIDPINAPLQKAKERLKNQLHVRFQQMTVPQELPEERFDLILLSEVGYYLSWDDLKKLGDFITEHLETGGQFLMVHWTPFVPDYPLTGDQVHNYFMELSAQKQHLKHLLHQREEQFRLDLFEKI